MSDLKWGKTAVAAVYGNRPYKKGGRGPVPKAGEECDGCGICAQKCPAGAIEKQNVRTVKEDACIGCMRCMSVCPKGARSINSEIMTRVSQMLKKVCSEKKENELFL